MFERMVEKVPNRLQSPPSLCGLRKSSTEGFRTQIPRPTISWSCWSTLKCVRHLNFRDLVKIIKNRDFCQNLKIFLRFDSGKPLQTFSTSTELRVRCSVRFLCHHSRWNIRKTTKIKGNSFQKRIQNRPNSAIHDLQTSPTWGRPQPLQGWF